MHVKSEDHVVRPLKLANLLQQVLLRVACDFQSQGQNKMQTLQLEVAGYP